MSQLRLGKARHLPYRSTASLGGKERGKERGEEAMAEGQKGGRKERKKVGKGEVGPVHEGLCCARQKLNTKYGPKTSHPFPSHHLSLPSRDSE